MIGIICPFCELKPMRRAGERKLVCGRCGLRAPAAAVATVYSLQDEVRRLRLALEQRRKAGATMRADVEDVIAGLRRMAAAADHRAVQAEGDFNVVEEHRQKALAVACRAAANLVGLLRGDEPTPLDPPAVEGKEPTK